MSFYYGFRPYVPVAEKRKKAQTFAARLAKKEKRALAPIELDGRRNIATSFWGKAWCDNLECYQDYANRLPRGRTYVRNGSVIDLQIERGKVRAIVAGSEPYRISIDIKTLPDATWAKIKDDCTRSIGSLIDLLQGRFDAAVLERLTQQDGGLFPAPREIKLSCSCPDYAGMCKHIAATLYGVGARLDHEPELFFTLRDVDHLELINQAVDADQLGMTLQGEHAESLAGADLGAMFGIDLETSADAGPALHAEPKSGAAKKPRKDRAATVKIATGKKATAAKKSPAHTATRRKRSAS